MIRDRRRLRYADILSRPNSLTATAAEFGGTGITEYALGDTLYASGVTALAKLAGNTTTTRKFMRQVGTGTASAAPVWDRLALGDIPDLASLYQPVDGDLTSIAALVGTGYGKREGTNAWALAITIPWTDISSAPTTLAGYGISDAQPLDGDLTAIAALGTTSFGRGGLTRADASAFRTYIGAGTSSFSGVFADLTGIPTTLSGYGITDAQPIDSDLTAIAALTTSAFGRGLLTEASAATLRSTLSLVLGTNVQAWDADLDAVAAVATTSYGRSFLALAAAVNARNLAGLGTTDSPVFLGLTTDADFYFGSANTGNFSDFSGEPTATRLQPWFRRNGQNANFALQNTHTSYYSGFRFVDSAGNERGAMAWGNSASAAPFTNHLFIEYAAPASIGTVADFLIVRTLIGSPHEEVARFTDAKNLLVGTTDETGLLAGGGNLKCANVREKLRAVRTYYVRTDGSDSNTGQANTAGGAFLTIQAAIDAVAQIDTSIYAVTIQVADGTYTAGALVSKPFVGAGAVTLQGNTTTPANCIISVTGGHCVRVLAGASLSVNGFKITTTTSGFGVISTQNSLVIIGAAMQFGTTVSAHMSAVAGGVIVCQGNYSIVGAAPIHWSVDSAGQIISGGNTITITGTPAFATAFANAIIGGSISASSITFSGSATGTRYNVTTNAVVNTNGGGATYLPGNVGGSSATGGQYA